MDVTFEGPMIKLFPDIKDAFKRNFRCWCLDIAVSTQCVVFDLRKMCALYHRSTVCENVEWFQWPWQSSTAELGMFAWKSHSQPGSRVATVAYCQGLVDRQCSWCWRVDQWPVDSYCSLNKLILILWCLFYSFIRESSENMRCWSLLPTFMDFSASPPPF